MTQADEEPVDALPITQAGDVAEGLIKPPCLLSQSSADLSRESVGNLGRP